MIKKKKSQNGPPYITFIRCDIIVRNAKVHSFSTAVCDTPVT